MADKNDMTWIWCINLTQSDMCDVLKRCSPFRNKLNVVAVAWETNSLYTIRMKSDCYRRKPASRSRIYLTLIGQFQLCIPDFLLSKIWWTIWSVTWNKRICQISNFQNYFTQNLCVEMKKREGIHRPGPILSSNQAIATKHGLLDSRITVRIFTRRVAYCSPE